MEKLSQRKKFVIAVICAFWASIGLNIQMTVFSIKQLQDNAGIEGMHSWFRMIWDIKMSLSGYSVKELILTALLVLVFWKAFQVTERRIWKISILPAALFAFFEVFGKSFKETASWGEVFDTSRNMVKAGVKYVGLFLLFYVICVIGIYYLREKNWLTTAKREERSWFTHNWKSLFVVFALILLMWLPYAVADFPGLTNYDFFDELDTFYGRDTNSLRVVVPISEDVTLNNNNPVVQTMMAVGAMKLGSILGSPYIGIFIFCYTQMLIFAWILSYSIYYLSKRGIRPGIRAAILLFYGLLPWHANFALTTLKDTNFSFMMLLYVILLSDLVLQPKEFFARKSKLFWFAIVNLVLMLLRNNGIYVLLVVDVILLIAYRKQWKYMVWPTVLPAFVYMFLILHVLYPALKISPGSSAEMYSVPLQQIARLVVEHGDQIEEEDQEVFKKVLTKYDELEERYSPEIADPVKSTYNKYTTSEEMSEFLRVWAKYLVKYPSTYVQATICGCFGYFYPEAEHWLVYTKIEEPGLKYGVKSPERLSVWRQELNQMSYIIKQIPGLGLLVSIGLYTWTMICSIVMLIYRKEKAKILIWMPVLILLLTVLVGPVNTMPRYVYPMILSTPMILALTHCKGWNLLENTGDKAL